MKKIIALLLTQVLICALLCACMRGGADSEGGAQPGEVDDGDTSAQAAEVPSDSAGEMFTDRDLSGDYDEQGSIRIDFDSDRVTASSDSVQISGTSVTLTKEAVYLISGDCGDGMITVNMSDTAKPQLVLCGLSLNCEENAPLLILSADKVFVTLAKGTENSLSNGGSFMSVDGANVDGTVFSKDDVTFNGSGSLSVTSPAGHGIVAKDDLVICGGTYSIQSASHGLDANDSVRITASSLSVAAGKDGIHAQNSDDSSLGFVYIQNGSFDIEAEGDGVSAGSYMNIEGGSFTVLAGGGSVNGTKSSSDSWGQMGTGRDPFSGFSGTESSTEDTDSVSMKGFKSDGDMLISGGTFNFDCADDTFHSGGSISVLGGTFEAASGDDGFHADDTLTVTGGNISISECYEGLEALHLDISGGNITLSASDDGLNAAGGTDSSGTQGGRDGMFGGGFGGRGGGGGGMSSSSDGTIVISGGTLYIKASGDGIDANGSLTISGGFVTVVGPTQGDTATLDYDTEGIITGGTFIGTGASGMAQSFSDASQGVVAVSVGNQSAGTAVTLADKDGNVIISVTPELSFAVVILSSPDIASGESYTLTVGSASAEVTAG
ncbi:MAG: carbohydrate-binding domain-containing protein [Candidatus Avispirillum sp.]